jgi:hypothetical protein
VWGGCAVWGIISVEWERIPARGYLFRMEQLWQPYRMTKRPEWRYRAETLVEILMDYLFQTNNHLISSLDSDSHQQT